ncbi:uncharacterized protein PG998_001480 [Apiospora kogelbergensis]|uniref:Uncharacterized protein n=1 Tax=Apiospora kogelbergensis TaxID=1337665 RepID=A0AAW0QQC1_9PEZI
MEKAESGLGSNRLVVLQQCLVYVYEAAYRACPGGVRLVSVGASQLKSGEAVGLKSWGVLLVCQHRTLLVLVGSTECIDIKSCFLTMHHPAFSEPRVPANPNYLIP